MLDNEIRKDGGLTDSNILDDDITPPGDLQSFSLAFINN
jgi:hypothetical protein